jgi:hypothetical protein
MSTELQSPHPWTTADGARVWQLLAELLLIFSWTLALTAVLVAPTWLGSTNLGDDLTRYTVRLALVYYAVALALLMYTNPADRQALTTRGRLMRWCWTLAWATYLVHLGMAFHYYHHWSHQDAIEHTHSVSGLGEGIYASHLFTLVWSADVATWWLAPRRWAGRSRWIDGLLHGFMLFIVFNATVVYETGLIRWAGVGGFVVLGLLVLMRGRRGFSGRRTPP